MQNKYIVLEIMNNYLKFQHGIYIVIYIIQMTNWQSEPTYILPDNQRSL